MDVNPILSDIERELQKQVSRLDAPRTKRFHEMLTYHMGWTGEDAGPEAAGKRIRPLLVLLSTEQFLMLLRRARLPLSTTRLMMFLHTESSDSIISRGRVPPFSNAYRSYDDTWRHAATDGWSADRIWLSAFSRKTESPNSCVR